MQKALEERFWAKVDKSGGPDSCWLWQGAMNPKGYGNFWNGEQYVNAHKFSWILTFGPILGGLWVLHNCPIKDNRRCVNPKHLFLGTAKDNTQDMLAKGGTMNPHPAKGEKVNTAKFTASQVLEIRLAHASGEHQISLATRFGVCRNTIANICKRKSWKHI